MAWKHLKRDPSEVMSYIATLASYFATPTDERGEQAKEALEALMAMIEWDEEEAAKQDHREDPHVRGRGILPSRKRHYPHVDTYDPQ